MIVVDTSVWIDHLRGTETAAVRTLRSMDDMDRIVVGDIVLLEVLQGARDGAHAARIERALRQFRIERMLDDRLAVQAAARHRELRRAGVTVRKTIDVLIGTYCLERGYALLHDDRDFEPMTQHLGLLRA